MTRVNPTLNPIPEILAKPEPHHDKSTISNLVPDDTKIVQDQILLPNAENWPMTKFINSKNYKFEHENFTCQVKNGQLFGFGYFEKEIPIKGSSCMVRYDRGIWRGHHILHLQETINAESKIFKILNSINKQFLPTRPVQPVLNLIEKFNQEMTSTDDASEWNISIIKDNKIEEDSGNDSLDESDTENLQIDDRSTTPEPTQIEINFIGKYTFNSLTFLNHVQSNDFYNMMNSMQNDQVDINVADKNGITSLILAATTSFNPKIVSFLINHGANVKQTMSLPNPFSALRICLSMLYPLVNFDSVLYRTIDPVEYLIPKVEPKKYKNLHGKMVKPKKDSCMSRFQKCKEYFTNAVENDQIKCANLPKIISTILVKSPERAKLKEIVKILIKRGSMITKYCLGLIVLSNDLNLLQFVAKFGTFMDDFEYTDYIIGKYKFNILHLAILSKHDTFEMLQILLQKLKKLNPNQVVQYTDKQQILDHLKMKENQLKNENSSPRNARKLTSRNNSANLIESLYLADKRPIDLAILKNNVSFDSILLLAKYSDQKMTCPIYQGLEIVARVNFIQLAISIHGINLLMELFRLEARTIREKVSENENLLDSSQSIKTLTTNASNKKIKKKKKITEPKTIQNFESKTIFEPIFSIEPTIFTIFNIIDTQYAPLKNFGDAESRLKIIDNIIKYCPDIKIVSLIPKQNLCNDLYNKNYNIYPSKTIIDFAYYQFYNFTKSRVALASLEKQDRAAINENKTLLRGLSDRFRNASVKVLSAKDLAIKIQNQSEKMDESGTTKKSKSLKGMSGKSFASFTIKSTDTNSNRTISNLDIISEQTEIPQEINLNKTAGAISEDGDYQQIIQIFPYCYECCRTDNVLSSGHVEQLKKLNKLTNLDKDLYFCSSFCKSKIIERLKIEGNSITIAKRLKSSRKNDKITDEITAMQISLNSSSNKTLNNENLEKISKYIRTDSPPRRTQVGGFRNFKNGDPKNVPLSSINPELLIDLPKNRLDLKFIGLSNNMSKNENYSYE